MRTADQEDQKYVTRNALVKMEQLVKLNDDLMSANSQLQEDKMNTVRDKEREILELQDDLQYYITRTSTLNQFA